MVLKKYDVSDQKYTEFLECLHLCGRNFKQLAGILKLDLNIVWKLVEEFRKENFRDSDPKFRGMHALLRASRMFDKMERQKYRDLIKYQCKNPSTDQHFKLLAK